MQSEQRCKTQAQKKLEAAEKFARIAEEREVERAQRTEMHRREALEEQKRKAEAEQKKAESKANKKKAAASAAAASPLLPSASSLAHMPEPRVGGIVHGDGDDDDNSHLLECDDASLPVSSSASSARVPMNHSTHIEGLLPFIAKLQKTPYCKTILPGALSGGHSIAQTFEVVFQSDSSDGAWHFVAKLGSTRQDLRITPKLKIIKLEMIEEAIEQILHPSKTAASEAASSSSAPLAVNSNRLVAAQAADAHRKAGQEKHLELREKEKAAKHARDVAEKAKRLKAKVGQKNESVGARAEAWVEWEK